MKSAAESLLLVAALLLVEPAKATRYTSPGKPKLTSCRSPEKETFTCWWKPGHDGGLSTAYALYYRKENSEVVYECPDYHTAGENSCFFNKNDTSIWVNYNITVVATNALGSNFSDPVDVDVVYIVQPHTPENVTATVTEDKGGTFLKVSWEPPHKADTRSGWITLIYELRVKLEGEEEWEEHRAGQQKTFNVFGLRSGGTYLVQLRCKPDHGFWSEWSSTTYVKVPDHTPQERSLWILIAVFAALVFLILTWLLNVKSQSVKHCLLPPVPGPKIKGFDNELLKNGRPEEVFNALVVTGFPPTSFTDYEDFMVEYLEINGQDEQELILEGNKEGIPKCKSSPSDNDSGRGSCDSRTLFVEKCGEGEVKEEGADKEAGRRGEKERRRHQTVWEEEGGSHVRGEAVGPDAPHGRVKTWPSLFPSPPERRGPLGATRQLCLSDGSFRPSAVASDPDPSGYGAEENTYPKPGCREFHRGGKQPRRPPLQTQLRRQVSHSDCDIPGTGRAGAVRFPRSQFTEYVEVHKVSQENVLVLQPLSSGHGHTEGHGHVPHGEDYSKVREVSDGNMLLLQRAVDVRAEELGQCQCENWERSGLTESCYTTSPAQVTGKPSVCLPTTTPLQGEMVLAANGYVDTANVLPTY